MRLFDIIQNRKNVAIVRNCGGLGDLVMHRMLFGGMFDLMPDVKITFACPKQYHPIVSDHPNLNKLTIPDLLNVDNYAAVYDTSSACFIYEAKTAPLIDKNRADIWAEACGFEIKNHRCDFRFTKKEKIKSLEILGSDPIALICPKTAMHSKDLLPDQVKLTYNNLKKLGFRVLFVHNKNLEEYGETLCNLELRELMACFDMANLVISADTGGFHLAGGLNKPVAAIFGWADGKIYGKHYKKINLLQRHRDNEEWCGPCHNFYKCPKVDHDVMRKPCISEWTAEQIWEHVKDTIKKYPECFNILN